MGEGGALPVLEEALGHGELAHSAVREHVTSARAARGHRSMLAAYRTAMRQRDAVLDRPTRSRARCAITRCVSRTESHHYIAPSAFTPDSSGPTRQRAAHCESCPLRERGRAVGVPQRTG